MAEGEDWDIYTWIGLLILSPILIPLLILLSPILIILYLLFGQEDGKISEGYDDEDKLNLASKELEKQKKENFKRQLKEVDEIIAKNNKRVSKREYQNKIKELAQSDKETLSLRKKMERHIEKLEYNVTNYHNQAKAINLYPERRDAYWCNGCEHNWVSRNIAGKSHICPKCRGDDLDNINLSERKKEHQRLIHNHKVCKKQIKDFSKQHQTKKRNTIK